MTYEHVITNGPELAPPANESYAQISIPGVPYSALRFPLGKDADEMDQWAAWAVAAAQIISAHFTEAFPPPPLRDYSPDVLAGQQQRGVGTTTEADRNVQQAANRLAPAVRAGRAQVPRGTGLYCPDHGVEVLKTAAKYDPDGDRYYHPLTPDQQYRMEDGRIVKNHNLYERQLVNEPADLPF